MRNPPKLFQLFGLSSFGVLVGDIPLLEPPASSPAAKALRFLRTQGRARQDQVGAEKVEVESLKMIHEVFVGDQYQAWNEEITSLTDALCQGDDRVFQRWAELSCTPNERLVSSVTDYRAVERKEGILDKLIVAFPNWQNLELQDLFLKFCANKALVLQYQALPVWQSPRGQSFLSSSKECPRPMLLKSFEAGFACSMNVTQEREVIDGIVTALASRLDLARLLQEAVTLEECRAYPLLTALLEKGATVVSDRTWLAFVGQAKHQTPAEALAWMKTIVPDVTYQRILSLGFNKGYLGFLDSYLAEGNRREKCRQGEIYLLPYADALQEAVNVEKNELYVLSNYLYGLLNSVLTPEEINREVIALLDEEEQKKLIVYLLIRVADLFTHEKGRVLIEEMVKDQAEDFWSSFGQIDEKMLDWAAFGYTYSGEELDEIQVSLLQRFVQSIGLEDILCWALHGQNTLFNVRDPDYRLQIAGRVFLRDYFSQQELVHYMEGLLRSDHEDHQRLGGKLQKYLGLAEAAPEPEVE